MKYAILAVLVILFNFCSRLDRKGMNKPLAKVGNLYLYQEDLKGLIKVGLSPEDSAALVASLAEKWIRKQLIIQRAELNLTDDEKDVNKELEDYRSSLLIYKYEQKFISEKLDTIVDKTEIDQYYNQNQANFVLSNDIVKAMLIQLPLHSPDINKVKIWYKSETEDEMKLLESYCFRNARRYDYFNDEWVNFNQLKSAFPYPKQENAPFLKSNRFYETKDSANIYLVSIKEYKLKGEIAPLKLVDNDIKSIILLKRKQKLINDLENKIYFDAMNKNNFTVFGK